MFQNMSTNSFIFPQAGGFFKEIDGFMVKKLYLSSLSLNHNFSSKVHKTFLKATKPQACQFSMMQ